MRDVGMSTHGSHGGTALLHVVLGCCSLLMVGGALLLLLPCCSTRASAACSARSAASASAVTCAHTTVGGGQLGCERMRVEKYSVLWVLWVLCNQQSAISMYYSTPCRAIIVTPHSKRVHTIAHTLHGSVQT